MLKNNKLKGRIIEKYGSIGEFAKMMGVSRQAINYKLSGQRNFSRASILKWCEALDIDKDDPVQVAHFFLT